MSLHKDINVVILDPRNENNAKILVELAAGENSERHLSDVDSDVEKRGEFFSN